MHTAGHAASPTYRSWQAMRTRCRNPRHHKWAEYGGRGIAVCERWASSFASFLADVGERPVGTTLDRIDVNGNYEPGNVRWATAAEQRANRRPAMKPAKYTLTIDGRTLPVKEWAKISGLDYHTIMFRVHRGYSHEDCLKPLRTWPGALNAVSPAA